jgi:hypothetical protein
MNNDPNYLFSLRVPVFRGIVLINAFESIKAPSHARIDVEVSFRQIDDRKSHIIFPHGQLYCGLPNQYPLDGIRARELVLSLVAMRTGSADPDYFEDYTSEQLAFAEQYGEELDCVRQFRYCDANGNVRERSK